MKTLLTLVFSIPLFVAAQVFPYSEGFRGIPSNTLPAGWSGDMKVRAGHGMNYDKGLAGDIGSTDVIDSAITPWIGPLDNNSEFYFWYEMVEELIYPSTEKHLTSDNLIISISTDSVNFTDLYRIDSSNHISTLSFRRIIFPVTGYGGQIVKFKFRCEYGIGSSYFVDIDSIKVRLNTNTSVEEKTNSLLNISPVPANTHIKVAATQFNKIELYNITGQQLLSEAFTDEKYIDVTAHAAGIYFVKLSSPSATLTRKIIIQH